MNQLNVKSPKGTEITIDMAAKTVSVQGAKILNAPIKKWGTSSFENKTVATIDIDDGRTIVVAHEYLQAVQSAKVAARREKLEAIAPGITALEVARLADDAYSDAFAAMMDDDKNDGAKPPKKPATDVAALEAKYPRAAMYILARAHGGIHGNKAMEIIESGGTLEAAQAEIVLANRSGYFD